MFKEHHFQEDLLNQMVDIPLTPLPCYHININLTLIPKVYIFVHFPKKLVMSHDFSRYFIINYNHANMCFHPPLSIRFSPSKLWLLVILRTPKTTPPPSNIQLQQKFTLPSGSKRSLILRVQHGSVCASIHRWFFFPQDQHHLSRHLYTKLRDNVFRTARSKGEFFCTCILLGGGCGLGPSKWRLPKFWGGKSSCLVFITSKVSKICVFSVVENPFLGGGVSWHQAPKKISPKPTSKNVQSLRVDKWSYKPVICRVKNPTYSFISGHS